jgi:cell division protease FtsH
VNRFFRSAFFPLIVIVLLVWLASETLFPKGSKSAKTTYSQLQTEVRDHPGTFQEINIDPNKHSIVATKVEKGENGENKTAKVTVHYPSDQSLLQFERLLESKKVTYDSKGTGGFSWAALIGSFLPFLLLIGFWIFLMNQVQGGGSKVMSFGKSRAKRMAPDSPKIGFKDVAGVDEAVEELQEIKEFLENPKKFQALGARIPKGVLLYGPPGTGKTLLARAVAGEAGVPFFSISGSDFVEMFVGVGASRVRDLFEQAKQAAPCIVFMDEIDAVGRHRGAGLGGGHDEREQTLNQLLVEMDGFESNEGVILVAATNRPDVLDPALLRPGRFDRRIVVNRPDVKGREGILAVHTKKIPLSDDVDVHVLARGTSGFSGADLANLVNEAALNAARYNKKTVSMADFEFAKDKVLMGTERRSMIISDEEKKVTAIHEAGHALLTVVLPHADPIHKVTIIPRGMALGVTQQLPLDDRHNYSREYLEDQIAILLGGRIAEEITNGSLTTGAGNDIERATELGRRMVCEWGMSDAMGPLTFGKKEEQIFLGREIAQRQDYSEDTAIRIDQEVKRFVLDNYARARRILEEKRDVLSKMAEELLVREVLDGDQVKRIVAGQPIDQARPTPSEVPTASPEPSRPGRPAIVPQLDKPVAQQ